MTGSPQANASITEFGHGGFTSAENKRCDDLIIHGIWSRGMASKNRTRKSGAVQVSFWCADPLCRQYIIRFYNVVTDALPVLRHKTNRNSMHRLNFLPQSRCDSDRWDVRATHWMYIFLNQLH